MATHETVGKDDDGARLDRWFKRHHPGLSHIALEKLLRKGEVRVDGKRAKSSDRLSTGQTLRLPPQLQSIDAAAPERSTYAQAGHPQFSEQERKAAEALVIHQDSSVMVLNKPSGLATQGGSGITKHVDGMLDLLTFGKKQRPRLVHRLDRDTSGVLVVARTVPAAAALAKALAQRDARKVYWALVRGVPEKKAGTIKLPLAKEGGHGPHGRDERVVGKAITDQDAKYALTDYIVIDQVGAEYAWIAAKPLTGRTHQIRVHLASLGTPIVGDFKYGGAEARGAGAVEDRLHLHARSIDIAHPDGGRLSVTAPLPEHMKTSWKFLGFAESEAKDAFSARRK
ncbi:MAG TPA: RluA family pseudouridine synthase [Rhizomicrobium sp.]|jgi:23S rRNA pseudouridine955/2504/2580 synthase|nr:RluA family pseudouridine synthase [Rhizomicrobium sp.]